MFFDPSDLSGTKKRVIDPNCIDPNIPKVDNSSVECDQIISTNCVVTSKGYPYLGIGSGETITSVIEKIKEKFKSISFTIQNLGTGLGILKGFSGGVLTAKTIAAGTNIQLTEANDTITINAIGGGSGGGGVINVTHSQLLTFKNTNQLSPGTFYRITDFRTMYDQPDFDATGSLKTSLPAKVGPIQPITVLAISNDTLSLRAYQEDYPLDVIDYILDFTTPVNNTVTKGRIIYRKDEFGNEVDFDFKNVVFKRYLHPILQKHVSFKDTSLASIEIPLLPTGFNASNVKSVGYFSTFQQGNVGLTDLPNNVILETCRDTLIGFDTFNSTFKGLSSSIIDSCYQGVFDVNIISSKIGTVVDSFVYTNGGDIKQSSIESISTSFIGTLGIENSNVGQILGTNLGNLRIRKSTTALLNVGTPNQNGLPIDVLTIELSTLNIANITGSLNIYNTYLSGIGLIDFVSNSILHVTGERIFDCAIKPNQIIKNLNILGDLTNENLNTSTIIYDTTLSKEIIKHPNGLYIKHYDQFGAAVINNVNA